jgi:osmotically-inducible protein OsmY
MKALVLSICAVAALVLLPSGAVAQDYRDTVLADEVARQVTRYAQFTIFDDVNVQIDRGVVTLAGKVTMPYKKIDIGKRVAAVDGVRELRNRIDVLPTSPFDEDLRYRIARAIYGNPSFWNYAAMANPPIHIIVEHGHVTLTGIVSSNVDRMLARSLATGFGELSVTNQLRTDQEIASRQSAVVGRGGAANRPMKNVGLNMLRLFICRPVQDVSSASCQADAAIAHG